MLRKTIAGITCLTLLTGCNISSRSSMYGSGGRTSYNIAAQNTTNQELLLNLVRLRYSDTPYFLELNGITTQFNFSSGLSGAVNVPGGITPDNPAKIGGQIGYYNQPTIQYSPLEGKEFAAQLMRPINLRIIQGLLLTGWDVNRIFGLLVQNLANIHNASSASGPNPCFPIEYKSYAERLKLLNELYCLGDLDVGVRYIPANDDDTDEERAIANEPNTIQISFPTNAKNAEKLAELLEGTKKRGNKYVLNLRMSFNSEGYLGILTRSLLGTMYFLSQTVDVPPEDIGGGVVDIVRDDDGIPFDWKKIFGNLFKVKSSYSCPIDSYLSVSYRGKWFYIDDSDVESKRTFVLLQQIYNLQARVQDSEGPLLTIPIGGK